jgi:hypothetical protein
MAHLVTRLRRGAETGFAMYDWIIEADIYRFRKALDDTEDRAERDRIKGRIAIARSRLETPPGNQEGRLGFAAPM